MKPQECLGCPLYDKGTGFAPPTGPINAPLCFVGEALGREEARQSKPFVGPAGQMLLRGLETAGLGRDDVRIGNIVSCQPPGDWLSGAPWERGAIEHCRVHRHKLLEEPHKVFVSVGVPSTRTLIREIGSQPEYSGKIENWRGTINETIYNSYILPIYHPAFLLRGNQKLMGVMATDIKKACRVATHGVEFTYETVVDPPPDWFEKWARGVAQDTWLSVDIETAKKMTSDEEEVDAEIVRDSIVAINFSYHPDQGITVPWAPGWMNTILMLLASPCTKLLWNAIYDIPRLKLDGIAVNGQILDFMWGWHILQSDLPRGLGFVSPFYSDAPAWKHLAKTTPGHYAAMDAVQTQRCAFGIAKDLQSKRFGSHSLWDVFLRHMTKLDHEVLNPATEIGLGLDPDKLREYSHTLATKAQEIRVSIQSLVPPEILPLHPPMGWKRDPERPNAFPLLVEDFVNVCKSCGEEQVTVRHKCETPQLALEIRQVPRWFIREEFNPGSPTQVAAYMTLKGHAEPGKVGKKRKTTAPSTDDLAIRKLAKKDQFYQSILDYRELEKLRGTYADGMLERMDKYNRIHPRFTHAPSTLRLSSVDPNIQNIVAREDGDSHGGTTFRDCVVPGPNHVFIEADYDAIEAVETGWFARDPQMIRLAKLGIHAYLTSHLVNRPASLTWSDEDLKNCFSEMKEKEQLTYHKAKRVIHGSNYGLTPFGMARQYPETFDQRSADKLQRVYLELVPSLPKWQSAVRIQARRNKYLGLEDHPYGYLHWFWDVVGVGRDGRPSAGSDFNRVVSFYPQSTTAGVIKESALELMDAASENYIGDMFGGKSPIRALIHDSILLEVPVTRAEEAISKLRSAMTRPIEEQPCPKEWGMGEYLTIGVTVKQGSSWGAMRKVDR